MNTNTFECDFCSKQTQNKDKWYALTKRPSCPEEIVAVMWGCPTCGKEHGLSGPEEIERLDNEFDEKGYADFGGTKCIFLTL